jgi:hypothetical protein
MIKDTEVDTSVNGDFDDEKVRSPKANRKNTGIKTPKPKKKMTTIAEGQEEDKENA